MCSVERVSGCAVLGGSLAFLLGCQQDLIRQSWTVLEERPNIVGFGDCLEEGVSEV